MSELNETSFWTVDPSSQKRLREYTYQSWSQVQPQLVAAQKAYRQIAFPSSLSERKEWVKKIGHALLQKRDEIAALMTSEMGKPLKESRSEIEKCASLCESFSNQFEKWLEPQTASEQFRIIRHPYGVVLGIMPWNFPFWQVFRYAIPALLSGNAVLLKHSDQVAGSAALLEEIFHQVLPDRNLFQNLVVQHQVAEQVIQSDLVNMVSFTGSTAAGSRIASLCGSTLKKCVLELGGNDAYVVASTADLTRAAKMCATGRLVNNGQSCVAAKRFLIHSSVFSSFMQMFQKEFSNYHMGAPQDLKTDLGPLSAKRFQVQVEKQCVEIENLGYQKIYQHPGNEQVLAQGYFFPPRIYVGKSVRHFYDEEIFGPVALCYTYENWNDVEFFVTSSKYGLGSALFSQDQSEQERFVHLSESGFIAINESVKSSPVAPFGGFKKSGFGRELGQAGFLEFTQTKTVSGEGLSKT